MRFRVAAKVCLVLGFFLALCGCATTSSNVSISSAVAECSASDGRVLLKTGSNPNAYLRATVARDVIAYGPAEEYLSSIATRVVSGLLKEQVVKKIIIGFDDSYNAASFPDGTIEVNWTVLRDAESEDEIAAVIAHEAGHVVCNHHKSETYRKIAHGVGVIGTLALPAFRVASGWALYGAVEAGFVGTDVSQNLLGAAWTRSQELEADHVGVDLLVLSGYDPNGLSQVFGHIPASSMGNKRIINNDVSPLQLNEDTHPGGRDRAASFESYYGRVYPETPPIRPEVVRLQQWRELNREWLELLAVATEGLKAEQTGSESTANRIKSGVNTISVKRDRSQILSRIYPDLDTNKRPTSSANGRQKTDSQTRSPAMESVRNLVSLRVARAAIFGKRRGVKALGPVFDEIGTPESAPSAYFLQKSYQELIDHRWESALQTAQLAEQRFGLIPEFYPIFIRAEAEQQQYAYQRQDTISLTQHGLSVIKRIYGCRAELDENLMSLCNAAKDRHWPKP